MFPPALGRHLIASTGLAALALPSAAAERELDQAPPPSSAEEIQTPIQRVFPEVERRMQQNDKVLRYLTVRLDGGRLRERPDRTAAAKAATAEEEG